MEVINADPPAHQKIARAIFLGFDRHFPRAKITRCLANVASIVASVLRLPGIHNFVRRIVKSRNASSCELRGDYFGCQTSIYLYLGKFYKLYRTI